MTCCTLNAWSRSREDYPATWKPVAEHPGIDRTPWTPIPDDSDQGVYFCSRCGDIWTLWRDPKNDLLLSERLPAEVLSIFGRGTTLAQCFAVLLILPPGPSRRVWREVVREIVPRQPFLDQWRAAAAFAQLPGLSIGHAEQLLSCLQQLLEEASRPEKAGPDGGVSHAPLDSAQVEHLLGLPRSATNSERLNPTDAALSRIRLKKSLQSIGRWLARNRSTVEMGPDSWIAWAELNDTEGRRERVTATLTELAERPQFHAGDIELALDSTFELRDTMSGKSRFRPAEIRALLGLHNHLLTARFPAEQELHRAAIAALRELLRFVRTGNNHLPLDLLSKVEQGVLDREPTQAELGY